MKRSEFHKALDAHLDQLSARDVVLVTDAAIDFVASVSSRLAEASKAQATRGSDQVPDGSSEEFDLPLQIWLRRYPDLRDKVA